MKCALMGHAGVPRVAWGNARNRTAFGNCLQVKRLDVISKKHSFALSRPHISLLNWESSAGGVSEIFFFFLLHLILAALAK